MTLAEGVQRQPCRYYIVHSILPQVDVAKEGSCVLPRRQARGSRWRLGMIQIKIAKEKIFFPSPSWSTAHGLSLPTSHPPFLLAERLTMLRGYGHSGGDGLR